MVREAGNQHSQCQRTGLRSEIAKRTLLTVLTQGETKMEPARKQFAPGSHVTVIRHLNNDDVPHRTEEYPEDEHSERAYGSPNTSTSVKRTEDDNGKEHFEGVSVHRTGGKSNLLPGYQSHDTGVGVAKSSSANEARKRAFNRASTERLEQTKPHNVKAGMDFVKSKDKTFNKDKPTPVIKFDDLK